MITNTRITDEDFYRQRKEVLSLWKTGQEVDLDEAAAYHKSILATQNMAVKIDEARKRGEILLTSDMGHTTIEQEIESYAGGHLINSLVLLENMVLLTYFM